MKFHRLAALSAVIVMALSATAQARVTKEEKSLTDKNPAATVPATSTPAPSVQLSEEEPTAGYKPGGFFIQSKDGKNKMVIGGYTQFHFEYDRKDGENDLTAFRIRRARLSFSGNLFTKKFNYKLQLDFVKFKSELLLDAVVSYQFFGDTFAVALGQQFIPFIREQYISSSNRMLIDRSIASLEFINGDDVDSDGDGIADKLSLNGRDIGLLLYGMPFNKKLEYSVGLFNGNGTNTTNLNNKFLYQARLVYNILGYAGYGYEGDFEQSQTPAVYVGGAMIYNTRSISDDNVFHFDFEAGLKYKGLAIQAELMGRHTDFSEIGRESKDDYGYYILGGYFVIPKRMEVAARASQIFFDGPDNNKGEFMLGLNGFLYDTRLKLQTDYSYLPTDRIDGTENDHRWRLRLQVKL